MKLKMTEQLPEKYLGYWKGRRTNHLSTEFSGNSNDVFIEIFGDNSNIWVMFIYDTGEYDFFFNDSIEWHENDDTLKLKCENGDYTKLTLNNGSLTILDGFKSSGNAHPYVFHFIKIKGPEELNPLLGIWEGKYRYESASRAQDRAYHTMTTCIFEVSRNLVKTRTSAYGETHNVISFLTMTYNELESEKYLFWEYSPGSQHYIKLNLIENNTILNGSLFNIPPDPRYPNDTEVFSMVLTKL